MRAAIYVRVSTQEQAEEGYSIKAQLERLQAYAASQDWKIIKTYIDDGQSAKDMKRTDLSRMLEDMEKDVFDCVLVYRLDRLTRSVLDLYTMLNTFEKYNVKFKSATEVYDTTNAMGRLFITLVAALAQWERENLAERVRMGMSQKAKEGKWAVSLPPFGYDKDGKDYLVINEEEASYVKEIFEMYTSGKYGTGKIARIFNLRGIKTKAGANWRDTTIRYVLTNPIYKGTMRYNYRVNKENYFEIEDAVPLIIREDLFDEVQQILNFRSTKHPRKATSPYIFTSVLKCARCGGNMAGKQSGSNNFGNTSYHYYCTGKKAGRCNLPTISQNFLEVRFLELIESSNFEYLHLTDEEIMKSEPIEVDEDKPKRLQGELKEIEERRIKWQYAWLNNLINDDDLKKRNEEENEREQLVKSELKKLEQNDQSGSKTEELIDALGQLRENWNVLEIHEKKKFIELIVKEINVNKSSSSRTPHSVIIENIEFL